MSAGGPAGAVCSGCRIPRAKRRTMKLWKSGLATVASAGALVLAGLAAPAGASDEGHGDHHGNMITVVDRCDPATFNAMFPPGTCVATPGTHVTVGNFFAALTANPAG